MKVPIFVGNRQTPGDNTSDLSPLILLPEWMEALVILTVLPAMTGNWMFKRLLTPFTSILIAV
ncbi:MAG: hypothetical protein AVO38_10990 [delta proteobacterium ML8_D]|nr:MAG: hypothetical protein AVO34_05380 [Firmicutes bacterium ML8_F2]OPL15112.1 MAG: hypothetical protein AVO38_10990 [delta proteobacterium ML8_D]